MCGTAVAVEVAVAAVAAVAVVAVAAVAAVAVVVVAALHLEPRFAHLEAIVQAPLHLALVLVRRDVRVHALVVAVGLVRRHGHSHSSHTVTVRRGTPWDGVGGARSDRLIYRLLSSILCGVTRQALLLVL